MSPDSLYFLDFTLGATIPTWLRGHATIETCPVCGQRAMKDGPEFIHRCDVTGKRTIRVYADDRHALKLTVQNP